MFSLKVSLFVLLGASDVSGFGPVAPFSRGLQTAQYQRSHHLLQVLSLADQSEEVTAAQVSVTEVETTLEVEVEAPDVVSVDNQQSEASTDAEKTEEQKKVLAERYTLYVGNLPYSVTMEQVRDLFSEHVGVRYVSLPTNRETGNIKGFAFVDVESEDMVSVATEKLDGLSVEGRTIRVSRSLPKDQVRSRKEQVPGSQKLYVGNLPFDCTKEDVKNHFAEFAQVTDVFIPVSREGRPRGFAFVSVKEEESTACIEASNGVEFMGRALSVNLPLTTDEKKARREERPRRQRRSKIFVGNLSFYTTSDTLVEVFEEFGEVYDCYIPDDPMTGNSRGFGFITMDADAAHQAIESLDGFELDGRMIGVNEAKPRDQSPRTDDDTEDSSE